MNTIKSNAQITIAIKRLAALNEQAKQIEKERDSVKKDILAFVGLDGVGEVTVIAQDEEIARVSTVPFFTIDASTLRKEEPEVANRFTREGTKTTIKVLEVA